MTASLPEFSSHSHNKSWSVPEVSAAQEKDGQKVIAEFQKVQSSCLVCHQTFRAPFVEHFYGKQATENAQSK